MPAITEIKAFVPAKDYECSKRFYRDLGFTMVSDGGDVACFRIEEASFLLQDFYVESLAANFMMHLLVPDVERWRQHVDTSGVASTYDVRVTDIELQPWGMREFCLFDPSGVLWRVAQKVQ
jgi:catechol 2,3-dioxygenase-like lactoylglutathione lyase family enzyme